MQGSNYLFALHILQSELNFYEIEVYESNENAKYKL